MLTQKNEEQCINKQNVEEDGFVISNKSETKEVKEDSKDEEKVEYSGRIARARVLYDFEAKGKYELSVKKGKIIYMYEDFDNDGWTPCRVGSKYGCVPTDYLQQLEEFRDELPTKVSEIIHEAVIQKTNQIIQQNAEYSRFLVIVIENYTNVNLENPQLFLSYGASLYELEIIPKSKACILAFRNDGLFSGIAGVLTYRLQYTDKQLAIMFQIPYGYGLYSNWYNLNIISDEIKPNQELFNKMISSEEEPQQAGSLVREEFNFVMKGFMKDESKTALIVELRGEVIIPKDPILYRSIRGSVHIKNLHL